MDAHHPGRLQTAEARANAPDEPHENGPCPDGLPPFDTKRWVARRKAEVLAAIDDGRISRADACRRYAISEAELCLWERALRCAGIPGLRVTRVQIYRPVFDAEVEQ